MSLGHTLVHSFPVSQIPSVPRTAWNVWSVVFIFVLGSDDFKAKVIGSKILLNETCFAYIIMWFVTNSNLASSHGYTYSQYSMTVTDFFILPSCNIMLC